MTIHGKGDVARNRDGQHIKAVKGGLCKQVGCGIL